MEKSILLLTNAYPDFPSSYRGRFIKSMAQALKKEGYAVSVVTPKIYRQSPRVEDDGGIKVFRFPFGAGNKLLIEHEKIPCVRMVLYFLTGCFTTAYVALKHRCNLVHVHWAIPTGLIGVWAGTVLRKPLVVTVHGSDFGMATTRGPLLRKMFVYVCRRASYLTCVSENMRQAMEQMGIRDKRIEVFPMGVEEAFFEVGKSRGPGLNNEGPVILSNRNLQPLYNVSHLIRAIPRVLKEEPHARFLIAGDGQERAALEKEAGLLGISSSLQFLGKVPHEEILQLLAAADIYVSTSLQDGASVSLLEAMAAGVFPVVTDIPANREWIREKENGFLVVPNDEVGLARKIVAAIRETDLSLSARKANRELVAQKAHACRAITGLLAEYERLMV
jgi:glycosyltransferase involved in cell wall biosynthesis